MVGRDPSSGEGLISRMIARRRSSDRNGSNVATLASPESNGESPGNQASRQLASSISNSAIANSSNGEQGAGGPFERSFFRRRGSAVIERRKSTSAASETVPSLSTGSSPASSTTPTPGPSPNSISGAPMLSPGVPTISITPATMGRGNRSEPGDSAPPGASNVSTPSASPITLTRRAHVKASSSVRSPRSTSEDLFALKKDRAEHVQKIIGATVDLIKNELQNPGVETQLETDNHNNKNHKQSGANNTGVLDHHSELLHMQPGDNNVQALRKFVSEINILAQTHILVHVHLDADRVISFVMKGTATMEDLALQIEATAALEAGIKKREKPKCPRTEFLKAQEIQDSSGGKFGDSEGSLPTTVLAASAPPSPNQVEVVKNVKEDSKPRLPEKGEEKEIPAYRGHVAVTKVFAITNQYNNTLPFDAMLEEVVETDEHLYVGANITEVRTVQSGGILHRDGLPVLTNNAEALRSLYEGQEKGPRFTLQEVLGNHTALSLFCEFCIGVSCLEYFMFWLEVELLRKQPPTVARVMAMYLYVMYMAKSAPLRIEFRQGVHDEVLRALSASDSHGLAQANAQIISAFDKGQLSALYMLRHRAFHSFTRTHVYQELAEVKEGDPDLFNRHKLVNGVSSLFQPDINILTDVCQMAKNYRDGIPSFSAKIVLNRAFHSYFPTAEPVIDYKSNKEHQMASRVIRERKKKRLMKFFGDAPPAQSNTFQNLLLNQMCDSFPELDQKTLDPASDRIKKSTASQLRKNSNKYDESVGASSPIKPGAPSSSVGVSSSSSANHDESSTKCDADKAVYDDYDDEDDLGDDGKLTPARMFALAKARKQQSQKLSSFFGESIQQRMITSVPRKGLGVSIDAAMLSRLENSERRELSSEEKAVLTKRRRKIQQMLGVGACELGEISGMLRETYLLDVAKKESTEGSLGEFGNVTAASNSASQARQKNGNSYGEEGNKSNAENYGGLDDSDGRDGDYEEDDELYLDGKESARARPEWLKKREKLGQILGESNVVPNKQALVSQTLGEQGPLPTETAARVQRNIILHSQKLRKVFGQPPAISHLKDFQRRTLGLRNWIMVLSRMLDDKDGLNQMIKFATDQEKQANSVLIPALCQSSDSATRKENGTSAPGHPLNIAIMIEEESESKGDYAFGGEQKSPADHKEGSGTDEQAQSEADDKDKESDSEDKKSQDSAETEQMKKRKKLRQIFGDIVDAPHLIERHIFADIERRIEKEMKQDEDEQSELYDDLDVLRLKVEKLCELPDGLGLSATNKGKNAVQKLRGNTGFEDIEDDDFDATESCKNI